MKQDKTEAKEYNPSKEVLKIITEHKGAEQYSRLIKHHMEEMLIDDWVRAENVLKALKNHKVVGGRICCDL